MKQRMENIKEICHQCLAKGQHLKYKSGHYGRFIVAWCSQRRLAVTLAAFTVFMGLGFVGIASAQDYYEVNVGGQTVAYVHSKSSVDLALNRAARDMAEQGKEVIKPVVPVRVAKASVAKEEKAKPEEKVIGEALLYKYLKDDTEWLTQAVVMNFSDHERLVFKDQEQQEHFMKRLEENDKKAALSRLHPKLMPMLQYKDQGFSMSPAKNRLAKEPVTLMNPEKEIRESELKKNWTEERVDVSETAILDETATLSKNHFGRVHEEEIKVKMGEQTSELLHATGLSLSELQALNPNLDFGHIAPGTKIKVKWHDPFVAFTVTSKEKREAYTPFEVKFVDNPNLMVGEYLIQKQGSYGKVRIEDTVVERGGRELSRKEEKRTEILAPDFAVVERGTKVLGSLEWPVQGPITSPFGERSWENNVTEFHRGVDIAAPTGTPVKAPLEGKVVFAGEMGSYGNVIFLIHENGLETRYAHLSAIKVKVGDSVKLGDIIGLVGTTGNSTGPHLHFETIDNGHLIDPQRYLKKK